MRPEYRRRSLREDKSRPHIDLYEAYVRHEWHEAIQHISGALSDLGMIAQQMLGRRTEFKVQRIIEDLLTTKAEIETLFIEP